MRNIYRQGDVVIIQVGKIPDDAKIIVTKPLAIGEVTGHAHRLVVKEKLDLAMYEDTYGRLYFKLNAPADVVHEEHQSITLPPGIYTTRTIREYDYISETIQSARD